MRDYSIYVPIDPKTTSAVGRQGTCPVCGYFGPNLTVEPVRDIGGGTYVREGQCARCGQRFRNFYDYKCSELELPPEEES